MRRPGAGALAALADLVIPIPILVLGLRFGLVLGLVLGPVPARATEEPAPLAAERVAGLCRAWTAVRYLHPGLPYRQDLDWDRAFVEAAPAALAAEDTTAYREIAEHMLAHLGDPATRLQAETPPRPPQQPPPSGEPPMLFRRLAGGVVLIDVAGFVRARGAYELYRPLSQELPGALGETPWVVVDLRAPEGAEDEHVWMASIFDSLAAGQLAAREVAGPAERWLVHWGYRGHGGFGYEGYRSAAVTGLSPVFAPAAGVPAERRVVFLANERTVLPAVAVALQAAGLAKIVSQGSLSAARVTADLGEGLAAEVRASDLLNPNGSPLAADVELPAAEPPGSSVADAATADPAVEAALRLFLSPFEERAAPAVALGTAAPELARHAEDRAYPEMAAPDLGHRLLAGCRLWGVIHTFYPYLELIGDWDGAFLASLPRLAVAEDADAYARAVLTFAANVHDSHTSVYGHPAVHDVLPPMRPPVDLLELEEGFAVVRVLDPALEDVHPGDLVLAVGGVPLERRIGEILPYVGGSTEIGRRRRAAFVAISGHEGERVRLTLQGARGAEREVALAVGRPLAAPDERPSYRLLGNPGDPPGAVGIGFVDLTRLTVADVEPMVAALAGAPAIVFDMRGYPQGTFSQLGSRFNRLGATVHALFRRREVSKGEDTLTDTGYVFAQEMPPVEEPVYSGRVAMLIDERAISQSEHTALAFEQAADAVFVGSPTAGANGDVTRMVLPGGIYVGFTGHDVRHADGRQLQRLGIQPHVSVRPTAAGLREGRDEVLEAAVAYLRRELGE